MKRSWKEWSVGNHYYFILMQVTYLYIGESWHSGFLLSGIGLLYLSASSTSNFFSTLNLNNIFSGAYTSNSLPTSTLFWQCFHCVAFNAILLLKDGEFYFWNVSKRNVYLEGALLITPLFQAWHSLAFPSSSCSCFNKSFARPFLLSTHPHILNVIRSEILVVSSRVEQFWHPFLPLYKKFQMTS